MKDSIVQTGSAQCYFCGRQHGLERHHILAGVANRKLSDKYGLWVYLCHNCHTGTEGAQYEKEKNIRLKEDAQRSFEKAYSHSLWMNLFRKNYL